MYCKILRNTVLWTHFLASCREINQFSVSQIGREPAKAMIFVALVGAAGGCLDIFSLVYHFSFLSLSLSGRRPDID